MSRDTHAAGLPSNEQIPVVFEDMIYTVYSHRCGVPLNAPRFPVPGSGLTE